MVRVGAAVRKFKPGDEVYARPDKDRIGTFAELISVHEDDLAPKPERLTIVEAAGVSLAALTAWRALVEKAGLSKDQKVFIQAGAGGVGTFAIQLAKHFGATVATTTSAANIDLVKRLGADVVIDYRKDDFETVLHDYDVVVHSLDDETLRKSLRVLKPGGRLISISGSPDPAFAREIGGAVAGQWEIAELVDHEEFRSGEEPHAGGPAALDRGLVAAGGEVGGGGEVDPVAGLGGAAGEGGGEHGLADSGWADEQHVGGVVEEPHGGEVADEFLVDAGLGGEVEVRERPGIREAGEPQPPGQAAFLGGGDLDLQQPFERGGE